MPVNIRKNNRYRALVRSIVQANIREEKDVKGLFSTLAKWRDRKPFEETEVDLKRQFAQAHNAHRNRREMEAIWMRILLKMPKPKYMN